MSPRSIPSREHRSIELETPAKPTHSSRSGRRTPPPPRAVSTQPPGSTERAGSLRLIVGIGGQLGEEAGVVDQLFAQRR